MAYKKKEDLLREAEELGVAVPEDAKRDEIEVLLKGKREIQEKIDEADKVRNPEGVASTTFAPGDSVAVDVPGEDSTDDSGHTPGESEEGKAEAAKVEEDQPENNVEDVDPYAEVPRHVVIKEEEPEVGPVEHGQQTGVLYTDGLSGETALENAYRIPKNIHSDYEGKEE